MIPKFRIYNTRKDIYADVDIINYSENYVLDTTGTLHNLEHSYLLLASNFKDKNDKTIYEGDIVKSYFWSEDKQEICYDIEVFDYDKNVCAFGVKSMKHNHFISFVEDDYISSEYEVIGNIYENKNVNERIEQCPMK